MEHVFISYSHAAEDVQFAEQLTQRISSQGVPVWIDNTSIRAGDNWLDEINNAIRSAYGMLLILTPDSVRSHNVSYEIGFASALRLTIVPLVLKPLSGEYQMLDHIKTKHHLNFTMEDNRPWDQLFERITDIKRRHKTALNHIERITAGLIDNLDQEECERKLLQLAEIDDHAAYEELLKVLNHPLRPIKLRALEILQELTNENDIRAMDTLRGFLHNGHLALRKESVKLLARIGPHAGPVLAEALYDRDQSVSLLASNALVKLGDDVVPILLDSATDRERELRVLRTLFIMGDSSIPRLIESLGNPSPRVREIASQALRAKTNGLPPLLDAAMDPNKIVRMTVMRALGSVRDPRALQKLLNGLADPSARVRTAAADSLGKLGDVVAISRLLDAMNDPDEGVREAAYKAIRLMGDGIMQSLLHALHNGRSEVRLAAAVLLRDLRDPAAQQGLINAVEDSVPEVRQMVIAALANLGQDAVDALIALLESSSDKRRTAAVWALADIGDPKAGPPLVRALGERANSPQFRQAAVWALGELNAIYAVPQIIRVLNGDRDKEVQRAAAEALRKIGTDDAKSAYDTWKRKQR
jgi:HEAT repeat protein